MTPLDASQDHVSVGPSSCHADQTGSEADLSCVFGDADGSTTVVLIGDGHARHWLPGLEVIAQEEGWRLISVTKSGCNPFDVPSWNSNFERPYHPDSAVGGQSGADLGLQGVLRCRSRARALICVGTRLGADACL